MLHTFAAGTWSSYQQQVQFLAHAKIHAFNYVPGQLCGLDPQRQCIRLSPMRLDDETIIGEREIEYDFLILAFGSRANDFDTPGVQEYCQFIDSQAEAESFNSTSVWRCSSARPSKDVSAWRRLV